MIVTFKERYQAEKFMFSPWNIPSVGEVQLEWMANPPIAASTSTPADETKTGPGLVEDDKDTVMQSEPAVTEMPAGKDGAHDMDYDVAEDDSWGVE